MTRMNQAEWAGVIPLVAFTMKNKQTNSNNEETRNGTWLSADWAMQRREMKSREK